MDDSADESEGRSQTDMSDDNLTDGPMQTLDFDEDPIEHARSRLKNKDYSVEPFLLRLLHDNDPDLETLQRCLEAGALLADLHFSRGSKIPSETIEVLEGKLSKALERSLPNNVSRFRAMFAVMGRLALHAQLENPAERFAKLTRLAERAFIFVPNNLFCLFLCIGKLVEKSDWHVAKHYFGRALSLVLTQEERNSYLEQRLKAKLASGGEASCECHVYGNRTKVKGGISWWGDRILGEPIKPSLLDELF